MTLVPWIEANAGLASLVLSFLAIAAAFYLAGVEYLRAKRAEEARTREPAEAALLIVDGVISKLQSVLDAKGEVAAEAQLVSARALARRYEMPLRQIAATPVPNAELIFALHSLAAAMTNVVGMNIPDGNEQARVQACEARIFEFNVYRPTLEEHAIRKRRQRSNQRRTPAPTQRMHIKQ